MRCWPEPDDLRAQRYKSIVFVGRKVMKRDDD